jgi:hypothetical protein
MYFWTFFHRKIISFEVAFHLSKIGVVIAQLKLTVHIKNTSNIIENDESYAI